MNHVTISVRFDDGNATWLRSSVAARTELFKPADGRLSEPVWYHMLSKFSLQVRKLLPRGLVDTTFDLLLVPLDALRAGPMRNLGLLLRGSTSIYLARQERALASTVEYVERNMPHVEAARSRLELLTQAFSHVKTSDDRLICEFGVFTGTSINHLAKLTNKTVFGFDSFEGLPESWGDHWKKGDCRVPKIPKVRKNVTLVKGWYNESLPPFLQTQSQKVCFLHIDCDLYSSVKTVFDLLEPRIGPGTVIVFDEYFNYPQWEEAEFKAFHEFAARTGLRYEYIGYNRNGEQVAVILR